MARVILVATRGLSRTLQTQNDFYYFRATKLVGATLNTLNQYRDSLEREHGFYQTVYERTTRLLQKYEIEPKLRRRSKKRSDYRNNYQTDDLREFFREAVARPMLDAFIESIENRFNGEAITIADICSCFRVKSLLATRNVREFSTTYLPCINLTYQAPPIFR